MADDNPRNEKPEEIRKEIIRNIKNPNILILEQDQKLSNLR